MCYVHLINQVSQELGLHAKATSYMYPPVRVTGTIGNNIGRFTPVKAGEARAEWNYLREEKAAFAGRVSKVLKCRMLNCREEQVNVDPEGVSCRAGRSSFWLTWDGKMLPCGTMDFDPEYPLETSFKTAWEQTRAKVKEIELLIACTSCNLRSFCGVCAANCKAETGAFNKKPQYLCEMAEAYCNKLIQLSKIKN